MLEMIIWAHFLPLPNLEPEGNDHLEAPLAWKSVNQSIMYSGLFLLINLIFGYSLNSGKHCCPTKMRGPENGICLENSPGFSPRLTISQYSQSS